MITTDISNHPTIWGNQTKKIITHFTNKTSTSNLIYVGFQVFKKKKKQKTPATLYFKFQLAWGIFLRMKFKE